MTLCAIFPVIIALVASPRSLNKIKNIKFQKLILVIQVWIITTGKLLHLDCKDSWIWVNFSHALHSQCLRHWKLKTTSNQTPSFINKTNFMSANPKIGFLLTQQIIFKGLQCTKEVLYSFMPIALYYIHSWLHTESFIIFKNRFVLCKPK